MGKKRAGEGGGVNLSLLVRHERRKKKVKKLVCVPGLKSAEAAKKRTEGVFQE